MVMKRDAESQPDGVEEVLVGCPPPREEPCVDAATVPSGFFSDLVEHRCELSQVAEWSKSPESPPALPHLPQVHHRCGTLCERVRAALPELTNAGP